LIAVAALFFRAIERGVGIAENRLRVGAVERVHADADACGQVIVVTCQLKWRTEQREQFLEVG